MRHIDFMCWLLTLLLASAATASELTPGRGLFFRYDQATLVEKGYPDRQHDKYFWVAGIEGEWGVLHDEQNIPYGPNTYFHWEKPLDHPFFAMTDSTLEGRWFSMNIHEKVEPASHGHFMELLDLSYYELRELLNVEPTQKISVFGTRTLEEYRAISGQDFWVAAVARGANILVSPVHVLDRRTLMAHTARHSVAKALLDWKCHGGIPPWLREGLASYLAEEGNELLNYANFYRPHLDSILWPADQVNRHLQPLVGDGSLGRVAQYNAFLMVWHLAETWGFARIQALLDLVEEGRSFPAAVSQVYGVDEAAFSSMIDPRQNGEPISEPKFRN